MGKNFESFKQRKVLKTGVIETPKQCEKKLQKETTLISYPGGNGQNIINIAYSSLLSLINKSELKLGQLYQFSYQTIHFFPNEAAINIGNSETFVVLATSSNTLARNIWSTQYPQDIIEFDPLLDKLSNDLISLFRLIIIAEEEYATDNSGIYTANFTDLQPYFPYYPVSIISTGLRLVLTSDAFAIIRDADTAIAYKIICAVATDGSSHYYKSNVPGSVTDPTITYISGIPQCPAGYTEVFSFNDITGWIIKRVDTNMNIECPYDFRNCMFNRYSIDASYNWVSGNTYAFCNLSVYDNKLFICRNPSGVTSTSNPETDTDNWLLLIDFTETTPYSFIINQTILGTDSDNSQIIKITGTSESYYTFAIDPYYYYYFDEIIYLAGSVKIKENSWNNVFMNTTESVELGEQSTDNTFLGMTMLDTISPQFIGNICGNEFINNQFKRSWQNNIYCDYFLDNWDAVSQDLGFSLLNIFGQSFISNTIGIYHFGNIHGEYCLENEFGFGYQQNISKENFQLNKNISMNVTNTNFLDATYVYTEYEKFWRIFKTASSTGYGLVWYDGSAGGFPGTAPIEKWQNITD